MPPTILFAAAMLSAALLVPAPIAAQEEPVAVVQLQREAPETLPTLAELQWVARPVVVFADSPNDPRFSQQLDMLEERLGELQDRDVVVLFDTDPAARGELRRELRPRGFTVVLIDKDGSVAKRIPNLTTARELINLIDRMPSRRQETGSRRQ